MDKTWEFAFLIPHVDFRDPIEHGSLALVPQTDPRFLALAKGSLGVSQLLTQFTDQFGEEIQPSALLISADRPATIDYYAVTSFRNCIAITSIKSESGFPSRHVRSKMGEIDQRLSPQ